MSDTEKLKKAMVYIEEHFMESITIPMLATITGYSASHFSREFTACYGISVATYIRRIRLCAAVGEIDRGAAVTVAAQKYNFSSSSVFTRAFHREFGISPREYCSHRAATADTHSAPGGKLKPKFKSRPAMKAVCYLFKRKKIDSKDFAEVSAYWYHIDFSKLDMVNYARLTKDHLGEIGVWYRKNSSIKSLWYMYGAVVNEFEYIPAGMHGIEIPAADYAVFTTKPTDLSTDSTAFYHSVCDLWKEIFSSWLPNNPKYEYDSDKLSFEFYSPISSYLSGTCTVMDIYIPIKKKL